MSDIDLEPQNLPPAFQGPETSSPSDNNSPPPGSAAPAPLPGAGWPATPLSSPSAVSSPAPAEEPNASVQGDPMLTDGTTHHTDQHTMINRKTGKAWDAPDEIGPADPDTVPLNKEQCDQWQWALQRKLPGCEGPVESEDPHAPEPEEPEIEAD